MKWFMRHSVKLEVAVCRLCNSKFYYSEAEQVQECPKCKYTGKRSKREQESLDRIKGQGEVG